MKAALPAVDSVMPPVKLSVAPALLVGLIPVLELVPLKAPLKLALPPVMLAMLISRAAAVFVTVPE